MEFSNPFDNPQGQFAILQNDQGQYSLWPQQCELPAGWRVVCEAQSQEACQQWLAERWRRLSRLILRGERMNRLPLVAAQPGIWMAEQLSTLPNAWSVAHYTELKGDIDAPLLAKAIAEGMMQADTLRMRFAEDNGEVWQWVDDTFILPEPSIVRVDSHAAAVALMEADLNQNLRVDSGQPLAFHQLIQVGENHWYWYQRYHHLVVDGFSFPAITRQIAAIYAAWKKGEPTPESPFTPFAEVVDEYQRYRDSEAYRRDGAFWAGQRKELPSPVSLSSAPLPGRAATTDILRLKITADGRAFSQLAQAAGQVQRTDLALALVALWLGASPDGWTTPPGLSLCAAWDPRRSPRPGRCLTSCRWRSISIPRRACPRWRCAWRTS
jgi:uncharacterized protein YbdZ (MbtH family)